MPQQLNFRVPRLGECTIPSPLTGIHFVPDSERVLYDSHLDRIKAILAAGTSRGVSKRADRESNCSSIGRHCPAAS